MGLRLSQRTGIISRVSIELREDALLEIERRSGLRTVRQELPLSSLSPDPVHTRISSVPWIGASAGAAVLALLGVSSAYGYPAASGAALAAAAACALASFVCAINAYRAHQGTYSCRQAKTGTEVISIRATSDGKRFVESLRETIKGIRYDESLSEMRRSEQHKKHVEYLLGEGVLTPTEFSSIMSRMERKTNLARLGRLRA